MRKIFLFLTALSAGSSALFGYLYATVDIFSPAKITTSLNYTAAGHTSSFRCYESTKPVEPFRRQEFSVLVWNIHKGDDAGWQQMLQDMSKNADFLLLQEVTDRQRIAELTGFPVSLYVTAFAYKNRQSGVNMLSRTAPYYYCAGSQREPWIIVPKVGAAARYPLPNGESLLIVNLHLVNFEWNPTNYQEQLTPMINQIGQHKGPIILAGDFNTWNSGRTGLIKQLAQNNGLQEVKFTPDDRLHILGSPLDHIFVRGLEIKTATTFKTRASDHNPLFATFSFEDNLQ